MDGQVGVPCDGGGVVSIYCPGEESCDELTRWLQHTEAGQLLTAWKADVDSEPFPEVQP